MISAYVTNASRVLFGTLVVEDLIAILMMVILSTMAVSKEFVGEELLMSVLKVVFFLILWFLIGIFILPFFLKKAKRLMNNETLLIVSLGLCLGMVVLATVQDSRLHWVLSLWDLSLPRRLRPNT